MKRVLVTGATGFIGRHCLALLSARGYETHALSFQAKADAPPEVQWHRGDLLDPVQVSHLIDRVRPSHLLHCAWFAEPGKYLTAFENVRWVQAGLHLLTTFASQGGQRVVGVGTCAEYDWTYGWCSEDVTPLRSNTLYGACKHAFHILLEAYSAQAQLSAAWGRVFFVYGPHEYPARLVPSVLRSALRREPVRCMNGNQIRDYLYVKDVADALVTLLQSDVTGALNIASGQPVQIKDIVHRIVGQVGAGDLLRFDAPPTPAQEPPVLLADVSRIHQKLHWSPRYSLNEGLEQTARWWMARFLEEEDAEKNSLSCL